MAPKQLCEPADDTFLAERRESMIASKPCQSAGAEHRAMKRESAVYGGFRFTRRASEYGQHVVDAMGMEVVR